MSDTQWLDDEQQGAWRAFVYVQSRLNARLGQQLQSDSALSLPDFKILVHLSEHTAQRMRIFELSRALQWEKSRTSHQLRRMEARGLVKREECPSDARGAFIVLSDSGRQAIVQAAPQHVEMVRRLFFDGLSPQELSTITTVFGRVLDRLDNDG